MNWSDFAHADDFQNFIVDFNKVITNSMLDEEELKMWQNKRINELHDKRINRKRLKFKSVDLEFNKENALAELIVRARKEEKTEKKKLKTISWKCDDENVIKCMQKALLLKKQKKLASNKSKKWWKV